VGKNKEKGHGRCYVPKKGRSKKAKGKYLDPEWDQGDQEVTGRVLGQCQAGKKSRNAVERQKQKKKGKEEEKRENCNYAKKTGLTTKTHPRKGKPPDKKRGRPGKRSDSRGIRRRR